MPDAASSTAPGTSPPGRIALIRHGQTTWSASGRHTSVTDVDLTPTGEREARAIPGLLAGLGVHPASVLVSPRRRARRTAELAGLVDPNEPANESAAAAQSAVTAGSAAADTGAVTADLVEWDYGDYEGLTTPQIRARRPGWELFTDGCPGGESPEQVGERADRLLTVVRDLTAHGDVALVCHGHISRTLTVRWVGLPVAAGALIGMDAGAVTVLGTYHGGPIIEHANVLPFVTGDRRRDQS
jgi:probable phosphoglycerate mutase